MTRRRPDWQARLTDYVAARARAPFAYGAHDCALFAAGAVEAVTGEDLAEGIRGAYADRAEGLRRLGERTGFDDPVQLATALFDQVAPHRAGPGDLAAVRTPDGPALGVVQGARVYVVGARGLRSVELLDSAVLAAWKV